MLNLKLTAAILATLALVAPQVASATTMATSPQACRLTSTSSPFNEYGSSGGFSDGKFWNNSGTTAWAMCPETVMDGNYYHYIATSSTTAACYLKATGFWGGGTSLVYGSRSGNYVNFYSPLTSGSYNHVYACVIPAGASVWGMMNY
jgi:hypothetical protein